MIKQLLEKHKQQKTEKQNNKPQFKLKDLYVGEIVLYRKRENVRLGVYNDYYDIEKKFAIFTETGYKKFCHIKSGQTLMVMGEYNSIIGDYAVNKIRKFQEACPIYMRKMHFTPQTKVSLNFIKEFEDEMNASLRPDQQVVDLFK